MHFVIEHFQILKSIKWNSIRIFLIKKKMIKIQLGIAHYGTKKKNFIRTFQNPIIDFAPSD